MFGSILNTPLTLDHFRYFHAWMPYRMWLKVNNEHTKTATNDVVSVLLLLTFKHMQRNIQTCISQKSWHFYMDCWPQKYLKAYLVFTLYQPMKDPLFKNGGKMRMQLIGKFELLKIFFLLRINKKIILQLYFGRFDGLVWNE